MHLVWPNYDHGTINLINGILRHYNVKTNYSSLSALDHHLAGQPETVVFIVLDGLGANILKRDYPSSWLAQHQMDTLTSVFPSTTTAAITTYQNGLTPWEHGWLGWTLHFKETNRYISPLPNLDGITGKPVATSDKDSREVIQYKHVFDQIHEATKGQVKLYYITTDKIPSRREGPQVDFRVPNFNAAVQEVLKLAALKHQKYIYLYWPSPDYEMHHYGTNHAVTQGVVESIDGALAQLSSEIAKSSVRLIISADHGHLDVDKIIDFDSLIDLKECCSLAPFIEPRAISFHVKPEKKKDFITLFEKYLGPYYLLISKEDFLQSGWLGRGEMHPQVDHFVGDFMAIATTRTYCHISAQKYEMKSHHAGITADEMLVPLILY